MWLHGRRDISPFLEDFLLLPEDFGVPEEQQLSLSLENDMDKVIILSENIGRFCRKQGIDKRRTHHLSLCIEEMTGNVVQHAFTDGKNILLISEY